NVTEFDTRVAEANQCPAAGHGAAAESCRLAEPPGCDLRLIYRQGLLPQLDGAEPIAARRPGAGRRVPGASKDGLVRSSGGLTGRGLARGAGVEKQDRVGSRSVGSPSPGSAAHPPR